MRCTMPDGLGWLFFFQAEDGIRDYKVTGVQTCALPIFRVDPRILDSYVGKYQFETLGNRIYTFMRESGKLFFKIGRASCREREEKGGGAGTISSGREEQREQLGAQGQTGTWRQLRQARW